MKISQQIKQSRPLIYTDISENNEVPVDDLSGDQGMEKTVMVTLTNKSKANLFETSTTLIKTIVGSGIISLPYTVSAMGWLFSLILFSVIGLANHYTAVLLLKAKNLSRHSTYNSIAYHIYSQKRAPFYCHFQICSGMWALVTFQQQKVVAMLSILKSSLRKLVVQILGEDSTAKDEFYTSQAFITIIVSLFLLPTVLIERIQSLRYLSVIGVFAIVLAIISLFIIFFVEMANRSWENNFTMNAFPTDGLAVLSVFPNIMFALVYQSNFFSIYKGLKQSTDKRITIATANGVGFSTILYVVLGIMGYCLYGSGSSYVNANFLLQINKQSTNGLLYVGIYLGFLISDMFCIPVTFMVARNNLIAIIKLFKKPEFVKKSKKRQYSAIEEIGSFIHGDNKEEIKKKAKIRFYIYTITLYAVYVFITIVVTSLAAVFNLVGAIASSAISFIVPFMFYFLLVRKNKKPKTINYFLSFAGIVIFVPLGILSIISLYI